MEGKRIDLKFSFYWQQKFKKRRDLRVFRSHGEFGDAAETAIDGTVRQRIPSIS